MGGSRLLIDGVWSLEILSMVARSASRSKEATGKPLALGFRPSAACVLLTPLRGWDTVQSQLYHLLKEKG